MQLHPVPKFNIQYQNRILDLSKPCIMGVLNVTPDSFSDGGKYNSLNNALRHAEHMIESGASIIDIGGESTRPNAVQVSEQEEIDRVVKVVEAIHQNFPEVWISIDTSTPKVIIEASKVGAGIWNDVRALTRPDAIETAAQLDIPVVLMHMRGEPSTMNELDNYNDVISDVLAELQQRIDKVTAGGVCRNRLIIDPGFGFAKNFTQNMVWLNSFYRLHQFQLPVMVAISRKRCMGEVLRRANLASDISERDAVSMMAGLFAVQQGACIIRSHHVAMTKAGLSLWEQMNCEYE